MSAMPVVIGLGAPYVRPGEPERWKAYGRYGVTMARAAAAREAAMEPLVCHHQRLKLAWSWLCPVGTCMVRHDGHPTEQHARIGWEQHCAVEHPDRKPAWPAESGVELQGGRRKRPEQLDLLVELGAS